MLFDWSRKLEPPSQPIRCKLKPIAPWSLAFSRATGRLHAFTSSCHWLPLIIFFTLIGRCDYFGFGFRHSIEKRSNKKTERENEKIFVDSVLFEVAVVFSIVLLPNVNFTLSFNLFQLVRTLCLIRSAKNGPTIGAVLFT